MNNDKCNCHGDGHKEGCGCHDDKNHDNHEGCGCSSHDIKDMGCNDFDSVPVTYDAVESCKRHEKSAGNNQWCSTHK